MIQLIINIQLILYLIFSSILGIQNLNNCKTIISFKIDFARFLNFWSIFEDSKTFEEFLDEAKKSFFIPTTFTKDFFNCVQMSNRYPFPYSGKYCESFNIFYKFGEKIPPSPEEFSDGGELP